MWRWIPMAWLIVAAVCAAPAGAAQANYRALLVGVSEYPHLRKDLSLQGPRNDVQRMRQALIARGVPAQSITTLADGVEGAALPTRAQILTELNRLASQAKRGDYIILLMAGHGSQSPVPRGSPHAAAEPDGKFEIFLPRDVEGWRSSGNDDQGEVKNAIHDHEIRALVDRMTQAGAFVWAIFDACHSATLVRSVGAADVQTRQVHPADLGIPAEAMLRAEERAPAVAIDTGTARSAAPASPNAGSSVFFYAAQTTEVTPELMMPLELPAGSPQRQRHGLFTFTVVRALEGGAGMTYQQLAQQILTRYGSIQEARVTPLFTGTALQTGVMGQSTAAVRQWALVEDRELKLNAGLLADIQPDSVLAILPSPIAPDSEAIGYAKVLSADMVSATLQPVAHGNLPARSAAELLAAGRTARMVSPALKYELDVAVDLSGCAAPCPFTAPLDRLKQSSAAGPAVPGTQIRWVAPSANTGLTLTAEGRRLWLAPRHVLQTLDCGKGDAAARQRCESQRARGLVSLEAGTGASTAGLSEDIARALHAVSRAHNLMRIASALSDTAASSQLKVSIQSLQPGRPPSALRPGEPMRPGPLRIALENTGRGAVDVSVFYLDSKYGITLVYPLEPGANNRLEAGAAPLPIDIAITDETLGIERLIVIGVEAQKHGERADYAFLASPALSSQTVTRSLSRDDDTAQLLRDAGFADYATRGIKPSAPPRNTGMQVFSWRVVPD